MDSRNNASSDYAHHIGLSGRVAHLNSELVTFHARLSRRYMLPRILTVALLLLVFTSVHLAQSGYSRTKPATSSAPRVATETISKNSWRGITPLRSTAEDVARELGLTDNASEGLVDGPFTVEDGEVSFSYLTPSLVKLYRAPSSMAGKVFTIYFKPSETKSLEDLKLSREYRRCAEQMDKYTYYFVSDAGVAYQIRRGSDRLEMIVYQPSRAQVQRLAVNTGCIF